MTDYDEDEERQDVADALAALADPAPPISAEELWAKLGIEDRKKTRDD